VSRPTKNRWTPQDAMRNLQIKNGTTVSCPRNGSRIGFALSSKDRVSFTLPTLATMDADGEFDLIWVDGSDTPEGKALPLNYQFHNIHLVEAHSDIRGGPDRAICFGLRRLLDLGYDYCGLIENDMVFELGWFRKLLHLFELAASDGIVCGAATVRSYQSRVIEYCDGYFLCWNIGAGMVLFSKPAAQLILDQYEKLTAWTKARTLYRFYGEIFGIDLRGLWDLWYGAPDHELSLDWGYSPLLYQHGFASVGSIPSLVQDLEFDIDYLLHTNHVGSDKRNAGPAFPPIPERSLRWAALTEPLFNSGWRILKKSPHLYRCARSIHHFRTRRLRRPMPLFWSPSVPSLLPTGQSSRAAEGSPNKQ
jgi:hypothetical protein